MKEASINGKFHGTDDLGRDAIVPYQAVIKFNDDRDISGIYYPCNDVPIVDGELMYEAKRPSASRKVVVKDLQGLLSEFSDLEAAVIRRFLESGYRSAVNSIVNHQKPEEEV